MTSVSYTVPPNWTAGSDKTGAGKNKNPNDPNMLTTGAYGAVLASGYNARPPAPEVLVKGGQFTVVKPRQTVEAMMADEKMPSWLG